ncbi:MAG: hypothetical protein JST35_09175 [Armatimonadetes bacterium]|nr:hypothetical protein [Armatimonadota bacterium]
MKSRLLCLLAVMVALCAPAMAQKVTKEQAEHADHIEFKMRQVNVLIRLTPILMTKAQINKLMGALEKARTNLEKIQTAEYNAMKAIEAEIDEAIKAGLNNNEAPGTTLINKIGNMVNRISIIREAVTGENVDLVREEMKKIFTPTQIKVIAGTFTAGEIGPGRKPEEIKEDTKLNYFIRRVLFDPVGYMTLSDMFKAAKPGN